MTTTSVRLGVAVCAALLACPATGFGQSAITDNEPVSGELTKPGAVTTWTIELAKQEDTIRIEAACKTTKLIVFVELDGHNIALVPEGGKGNRGSGGYSVTGFNLVCVPDAKLHPAMSKGKYTITVRADNGTGTGEYSLRVLNPKFPAEKAGGKAGLPAVAAPGEVGKLRDEVTTLRKRVEDLEQRLLKLEKR